VADFLEIEPKNSSAPVRLPAAAERGASYAVTGALSSSSREVGAAKPGEWIAARAGQEFLPCCRRRPRRGRPLNQVLIPLRGLVKKASSTVGVAPKKLRITIALLAVVRSATASLQTQLRILFLSRLAFPEHGCEQTFNGCGERG
jgi:hypothetical protein